MNAPATSWSELFPPSRKQRRQARKLSKAATITVRSRSWYHNAGTVDEPRWEQFYPGFWHRVWFRLKARSAS